MSQDLRETLKALYLDYFNNYISSETWSLNHNLSDEDGRKILEIGRRLHNEDSE